MSEKKPVSLWTSPMVDCQACGDDEGHRINLIKIGDDVALALCNQCLIPVRDALIEMLEMIEDQS